MEAEDKTIKIKKGIMLLNNKMLACNSRYSVAVGLEPKSRISAQQLDAN